MKIWVESVYPLSEENKSQMINKIMPDNKDRISNEELSRQLREQNTLIRKLSERVDLLERMIRPVQDSETETPPDKNIQTRGLNRSDFAPLVYGEKELSGISDSWDEILASINDGSYRTKYKLGNYKAVDVGGEGTIWMQIAAFDAEPLADGSGMAAITWIGMNRLWTLHRMNPKLAYKEEGIFKKQKLSVGTGSIGGWRESEMRRYLNNVIKPLMPEQIQSSIKTVIKYTRSNDKNGFIISNDKTEDDLWIPSAVEVYSADYWKISGDNNSVYYKALYSGASGRSLKIRWWTRSANYINSFTFINADGTSDNCEASEDHAVIIGFCT